jgi:hypothetical protein
MSGSEKNVNMYNGSVRTSTTRKLTSREKEDKYGPLFKEIREKIIVSVERYLKRMEEEIAGGADPKIFIDRGTRTTPSVPDWIEKKKDLVIAYRGGEKLTSVGYDTLIEKLTKSEKVIIKMVNNIDKEIQKMKRRGMSDKNIQKAIKGEESLEDMFSSMKLGGGAAAKTRRRKQSRRTATRRLRN